MCSRRCPDRSRELTDRPDPSARQGGGAAHLDDDGSGIDASVAAEMKTAASQAGLAWARVQAEDTVSSLAKPPEAVSAEQTGTTTSAYRAPSATSPKQPA